MNRNRYRPHYSVIRIERAKQKALLGDGAMDKIVETLSRNSGRLVMDWTDDDERALLDLVSRWRPDTGLQGLNILIDTYPFSGGTHQTKTKGRYR